MIEEEYDQNIVNELKKLPTVMHNSNGKPIIFDDRKRKETIFEHIANKKHHLYVRDIAIIPKILRDKSSLHNDKKSHKFKNYYGKRSGKNKKPYLKIICKVEKNKPEIIITIYTVRKRIS
ncbi:MAG: hypothetical protein MJ225_03555 [Bacilli bacterium]|nr:hypothetical protein [Bacilli bacterium]